jgi:Fic family protein
MAPSGTLHSDSSNLAEEGPIATLFSGPARTRIIEAFVANSDRELNVSDIARLSDTARSTVYRHIEELEKLEIIEPVGEGTKRYTLNRDDEIAEFLHKLEGVTLKRLLEKGE